MLRRYEYKFLSQAVIRLGFYFLVFKRRTNMAHDGLPFLSDFRLLSAVRVFMLAYLCRIMLRTGYYLIVVGSYSTSFPFLSRGSSVFIQFLWL